MHKTVRWICDIHGATFGPCKSQKDTKTIHLAWVGVLRTADAVRSQNGGRLTIRGTLSCTFLSYEDQKLLIWPKQGCGNITGREGRPPAVHRLKNNSIGTKKCRPAQNIADRQTVAESGQIRLFTLGVLK
ncbi:hypothetical protein HYC85_029227 [Camellia sinensis]|uniref:Uncharacterized protein n=1 Tax=Camellia sinensis TaxID=4442 RepID=A0A7J7G1F3_CAMSI|nr:hypothetical protein HYC85_029227 [Camellia sinensis]